MALNKVDLPDAADLEQEITAEVEKVAAQLQVTDLSSDQLWAAYVPALPAPAAAGLLCCIKPGIVPAYCRSASCCLLCLFGFLHARAHSWLQQFDSVYRC